MQGFLRDAALSFFPAAQRKEFGVESPTRTARAATWLGLLQFALFAWLLVLRYRSFVIARAQIYGPHVPGSEAAQAGALLFVTVEYFVYPLSLLLLYLTIEGAARFVAGIVSGEAVPSLAIFLGFKIRDSVRRRRESERVRQLPPDQMTALPDGRLRIATAQEKRGWENPNWTICVDGKFYEPERMDRGPLPLPFVYFLRPAPAGKVMRGVEEYGMRGTN